jgi:hypothetical protein
MQDVHAVDPTVCQHDGKWWMFVNIRVNEGTSGPYELFLFSAHDLMAGEWKGHPKNPIVSPIASSRSAGQLFSRNGNLYRPSQNNEGGYGRGMKINHVVTLSDTDYREVCVSEVDPLWDPQILGVHTLNAVDGLTVIDALRRRPRYWP